MKRLTTRKTLLAAAAGAALVATLVFVLRPAAAPADQNASTSAGASANPADSTNGTQATAAALTVDLVTPERLNWSQTLSASGSLAAWEEIVISPETGGLRIAELVVNAGQRVAKGQLLVRLADDTVRAELQKQEALVAQAEASLLQATGNLKRAQTVDVADAIAPQKLDEYRASEASARASLASARADLQSARLKLAQTRITAPDAGVVASKSGIVGNVASAGTELYRLIRQGRIEWRAELDARQLAAVREGQTARIELPGGAKTEGRVRLVSPTVSTTTGRGTAYVSLGADSPARAGVFASGVIELPQQPVLTLPETAVVARDGRSYVYLVGDDRKVSSRPVSTGRRQDGRVAITDGLDATTRVVAKGGAFLSDGAVVSVRSSATATTTAATATPAAGEGEHK